MAKTIQISREVKLIIPSAGEQYGIENLKAVARFTGQSRKKIKKYMKDGKLSFFEKIGSVSIMAAAIKLGARWRDIKNEFLDQSEDEKLQVVSVLVKEFGMAEDIAKQRYINMVDLLIIIFDFFDKNILNESQVIELA